MNYRTFHIGLLTYYDKEPKCLPKFGGLVRNSVTRCRKIGGAESLEEIRYQNVKLLFFVTFFSVLLFVGGVYTSKTF